MPQSKEQLAAVSPHGALHTPSPQELLSQLVQSAGHTTESSPQFAASQTALPQTQAALHSPEAGLQTTADTVPALTAGAQAVAVAAPVAAMLVQVRPRPTKVWPGRTVVGGSPGWDWACRLSRPCWP